ncbi:hypothetical protein FB451DRAFT_1190744 [Mycena latifolia]|nr:hypothetical protein FB451DRAFT_1190744 [Mycena latifolia]
MQNVGCRISFLLWSRFSVVPDGSGVHRADQWRCLLLSPTLWHQSIRLGYGRSSPTVLSSLVIPAHPASLAQFKDSSDSSVGQSHAAVWLSLLYGPLIRPVDNRLALMCSLSNATRFNVSLDGILESQNPAPVVVGPHLWCSHPAEIDDIIEMELRLCAPTLCRPVSSGCIPLDCLGINPVGPLLALDAGFLTHKTKRMEQQRWFHKLPEAPTPISAGLAGHAPADTGIPYIVSSCGVKALSKTDMWLGSKAELGNIDEATLAQLLRAQQRCV